MLLQVSKYLLNFATQTKIIYSLLNTKNMANFKSLFTAEASTLNQAINVLHAIAIAATDSQKNIDSLKSQLAVEAARELYTEAAKTKKQITKLEQKLEAAAAAAAIFAAAGVDVENFNAEARKKTRAFIMDRMAFRTATGRPATLADTRDEEGNYTGKYRCKMLSWCAFFDTFNVDAPAVDTITLKGGKTRYSVEGVEL